MMDVEIGGGNDGIDSANLDTPSRVMRYWLTPPSRHVTSVCIREQPRLASLERMVLFVSPIVYSMPAVLEILHLVTLYQNATL